MNITAAMVLSALARFLRPQQAGVVICCCLAMQVAAQGKRVQGTVINASSGEKIPFASISWKKSGWGGLTDSTGHFSIPASSSADTLLVSHVGFLSVHIPVTIRDTGELKIELLQPQVEKVIVSAKYNRGLYWWKRVVHHKKINDPYKFDTYAFQLYKKTEVDLNNVNRAQLQNIKLLKPFNFILDNIDSTSESKPYLPLFMSETISHFSFSKSPSKKREEITGFKTSGVNNEFVMNFIEGCSQQINIYDNAVTLFGKDFISPFSSYGDAYYNYHAADTQYLGGQRYLHLSFSPKRQGENTFSGDCWIHARSWAIREISLDISPTANINYVNGLSISQEFTMQSDGLWVFARDHFIADISPRKKDNKSLIVRQTRIYNHVRVNDPAITNMLVKSSDPGQIIVHDSAGMRPPSFWQDQRPEPLSGNEQKVYAMTDTLQVMPIFKKYVNTIEFLTDGRKKLGKVEIGPWYKWASYNQHEHLRLRFDLGTTTRFSTLLRLHGYAAYGFGDAALKGGTDLNYKFPGKKGYSVQAAYQHDLDNGRSGVNNGGISLDNVFSQMFRKPGIRQKFIQVDEVSAGMTKEWKEQFSVQLSFNRAYYETFNPLPPRKLIAINERDIITSEFGVRLRYAPDEKKISTHRKTMRIKGKKPVLELRYAAGIPGIWGSDYRYQKLSVVASQRVSLPGWGKVDYQVYGGKIWSGALPFMLLELHPGNETYYYSKQAFNLMNRFEYFSDRFAGFSVEHNFEKKLLNLLPFMRRLNVRQFWNLKAVWGDLSKANRKLNCRDYGSYHLNTLKGKPYMEMGTGLDNLFTYFRIDLVWKITPDIRQPVVYHKETMPKFGIFGSFHLQF